MTTKVFEGSLKTIPTDGSRTGSAVVYVYKAADSDPILDELFARRSDLKLRWSHGTSVDDLIGKITATRFLSDRVEVDFRLFETETATKVYEAMLMGAVTEFSVGFRFEESDIYKGEDDRWHVRRAELVEVSAVSAGANRETQLISIKSLGAKTAPADVELRDKIYETLDRYHVVETMRKRYGMTEHEALLAWDATERQPDEIKRMTEQMLREVDNLIARPDWSVDKVKRELAGVEALLVSGKSMDGEKFAGMFDETDNIGELVAAAERYATDPRVRTPDDLRLIVKQDRDHAARMAEAKRRNDQRSLALAIRGPSQVRRVDPRTSRELESDALDADAVDDAESVARVEAEREHWNRERAADAAHEVALRDRVHDGDGETGRSYEYYGAPGRMDKR
jgi:HK97 family phage prohead protease